MFQDTGVFQFFKAVSLLPPNRRYEAQMMMMFIGFENFGTILNNACFLSGPGSRQSSC